MTTNVFYLQFDAYLYNLQGVFSPRFALDEKSRRLLLGIFKKTDIIEPSGDNDKKMFFIRLQRGSYEDFIAEYEEGDTEGYTEEKFEKDYPEEEKWYPVTMLHSEGFRGEEEMYSVFINRDYVLSIGDPGIGKAPEIDAAEFITAFGEAVDRALTKMKAGVYNDEIRDHLPYENRYGKILRKDYWNIYPEMRKSFTESFSGDDREEFIKEDAEDHRCGRLKEMTARTFFEACAAGYKGAGIEMRRIPGKGSLYERDPQEETDKYKGKYTPREWYRSLADGRDDGLTRLPLDDPEAFHAWTKEEEPYYQFNGSHPWEVDAVRLLFFGVRKDGYGYYFAVWGGNVKSIPKIVSFYLAVKRAGYPIALYADGIRDVVLEEDYIEISPYGYRIGDCVSLIEEEKREEVIEKAVWEPEKEVKLKDEKKPSQSISEKT